MTINNYEYVYIVFRDKLLLVLPIMGTVDIDFKVHRAFASFILLPKDHKSKILSS
jgi:hypothetical protein